MIILAVTCYTLLTAESVQSKSIQPLSVSLIRTVAVLQVIEVATPKPTAPQSERARQVMLLHKKGHGDVQIW